MLLSIIVAVAENGTMGKNNALPWNLPDDLRNFKRVTLGKPIVMVRKPFESIGRPLPGRTNIVISRNPHFSADGIEVASNIEDALHLAERIATRDGSDELMVIGGAEVYKAALPRAGKLYVTEIHAAIEGDTQLPAIDWSEWRELRRERHVAMAPNTHDYSFVVYVRTTSVTFEL